MQKPDPMASIKGEDYWTHTLKSKAPLGLDVEDGPEAKIYYILCD